MVTYVDGAHFRRCGKGSDGQVHDVLWGFDVYQSILPDLPSETRVYFNDNDFLYHMISNL